jgi:hypothetical protein
MVKIQSILKPDGSIYMGIATAVLVGVIFKQALPDSATISATTAHDRNVDSARKRATLTSIGVLSVITLLTRDVNVFVLGGVVTLAEDFHARHANSTSPADGKLVSDASPSGGRLSVVSAS